MTPLRLRVDVCTYRGLREGVPGILRVLKRTGARATFFVAMGPDASGLALLKLLDPSFAMKMVRSHAVGTYGWTTAFYGTLLPSPMIGAAAPDLLRRMRDEGHEVGMHGWDHRRWQDRLPRYDGKRLHDEFRRMREAYRSILGGDAASFASPAWRVTPELLELEEQANLAYASDARGAGPFLPEFAGRAFGVPQLPVTLPTLDECVGRMTRQAFVERTLHLAAAQVDYACFTAHAEAEGRAYRCEFEAILGRAGRPVRPLGEVSRDHLPRRKMAMARVAGRPYDVCVQQR